MDNNHLTTANVNFNEKAKYISFTSPVLKNKKGHSRQITKSVRNIKRQDGSINRDMINEYIEEIKQLISNFDHYYSDYKNYLEAKGNFSEFAMNAVFDGTEFSNKYNQESTKRLMENTINLFNDLGKYILSLVLLAGVSAGGKTTTEKQMIGSTDTSFPATTQANTTVGLLYAIIVNAALALKGAARFTSRASLEERISYALVDIIKKNLSDGQVDLYNSLFEAITIFGDRKCKLQYIISVEDLKSLNLESMIEESSIEMWSEFKKEVRKSDLELEVYDDFRLNSDNRVLVEFGDYIVDKISDHKEPMGINQLFNLIVDMITNRVRQVVIDFIKALFDNNLIEKKLNTTVTIVDENRVHKFDNQNGILESELDLIKYPKFISLELKYANGERPDKVLRNHFFKSMEFISSASEDRKLRTLFPIVEEMRIYGNFRPLWIEDNVPMDDYILIDSEGLGHDMSQDGISIELRDLISQSKKIVFVQNGSEAIGNEFADALGLLITTGAIYKTKFCFNRLENFDNKSNDSIESRISFIKSGILNAIKKNVEREVELKDQIITGKEYVYEKVVTGQSIYFEHLGEVIENDNGIVPSVLLGPYKALQNQYDSIDNEVVRDQLSNAMTVMRQGFNKEFNPVSNINMLINSFRETTDVSLDEIRSVGFRPEYSLYKFTKLFIRMNEGFSKEFLNKVNNQVWQTVKAFNSRIAWNYDSREWSNLKPESDYIGYAQNKIIAFLLNPENIDDEKAIRDKGVFVQAISNMMLNSLSSEFKRMAENVIYQELLDDCWKLGISKTGSGSTYVRNRIINEKVDGAFHSEEKTDALFKEFRAIVFENEVMSSMDIRLL